MAKFGSCFFFLVLVLFSTLSYSQASLDSADKQLARDIFQQLIDINTTHSVGSTTLAAQAMAKRLLDAGFPAADVVVLSPDQRHGNMVARYRGTGARKPILLIGHLDVVEARRSDWTTDPFKFVEKDGYFYGRGTQDMKSDDAIWVADFTRLKREGYKPDRDLILALTADEEGGNANGVDWLIKNHRDLIDAEYVLNSDGGGVNTVNGKPLFISMDGSEKLYGDYQLQATNPGGHSSLPVPDNAIYHVTDALSRLEKYQFPFELNAVTRGYFERMSTIEHGQRAADMKAILKTPPDQAAIARLSEDPVFNATMRTTCVATRLEAGHANNALPQTAVANVNCRILPGHSREQVRQELVKVIADPKVAVGYVANSGTVLDHAPEKLGYAPVQLRPEVMQTLERVAGEMWPGAPVIPTMSTGASDGVYTNAAGLPTYGISGMAIDMDDVRAHGKDERVTEQSYYNGVQFYYLFLKALTSGK
ncbi:MAG TPA: M20/M25/M40 family metallo-hydrolase [Terriglobales bacterium]|nr:M20/M25/M40 family metallo-hydrolase [Terriglobales bacterium]